MLTLDRLDGVELLPHGLELREDKLAFLGALRVQLGEVILHDSLRDLQLVQRGLDGDELVLNQLRDGLVEPRRERFEALLARA